MKDILKEIHFYKFYMKGHMVCMFLLQLKIIHLYSYQDIHFHVRLFNRYMLYNDFLIHHHKFYSFHDKQYKYCYHFCMIHEGNLQYIINYIKHLIHGMINNLMKNLHYKFHNYCHIKRIFKEHLNRIFLGIL